MAENVAIFYQSDLSENENSISDLDSPMETNTMESNSIKPSDSLTSLQLMLTSIQQERTKEQSDLKLISSDECGFVMVPRDSFWVNLFQGHFLDSPDDSDNKDDMLFYVRKTTSKSKYNIPQTDIEVYRKHSKNQPNLDDPQIDWEETVYLDLILQHFEYHVTCAVCSRTSDSHLQILKKFTQRVYASPSRRSMDTKGTKEEITYPNIFFMVDNFEENGTFNIEVSEKLTVFFSVKKNITLGLPSSNSATISFAYPTTFINNIYLSENQFLQNCSKENFSIAFSDIIVRDSEMVCVELVAKDRNGRVQGIIFLGSIRYDALKKVYDSRASLSSRMAQRMSLGWYNGRKRIEFVRMRGPQGKGHAEMAVSRVKGSGPETPEQTPNTENFPVEDFEDQNSEENPFSHRRMSDPSQGWQNFLRGSFKKSGVRKSHSETGNIDGVGADGLTEVQAGSIEDEFDENAEHYQGFFGKSFGQAWHWFKEKKRINSVALNANLTYITLPWHRIIADILEENGPFQTPVFLPAPLGASCKTTGVV